MNDVTTYKDNQNQNPFNEGKISFSSLWFIILSILVPVVPALAVQVQTFSINPYFDPYRPIPLGILKFPLIEQG